jgi:preprotein translocase subunit SecG
MYLSEEGETRQFAGKILWRKEGHMPLMAWIDYGLIVVFFATIAGLIVIIAKPPQKDVAVSPALPPVRQNKMTYVFLAALCLFLLCMAFLTSNKTQSSSSR